MPVQSQKGSKGKRIMKIDEDSILCPMVFCPAQCRPHSSYAVSSNGIFELARFIKDYRCTFMGCNRPELLVYRTEFLNTHDNSHSLETLIGKVVNPLCCGSMEAMIFETVGGELQRRYLVNGDWCQVSSCCPSWLCCQKVRFFINDIRFQDHQNPNAVQRVQESQVQKQGKIEKIYSKFIKEFFSHGAHYKITFPENSSVDQKILILAAFQMLDMGYFDKKGCIPGICCC